MVAADNKEERALESYLVCDWLRQEAQDIWSIGFTALDDKVGKYIRLGHFILIDFPDLQGRPGRRCYSICGVGPANGFQVSVRRSGKGGVSDSLVDRMRPGCVVALAGVGGDINVDRVVHMNSLLMLASGIGVTLPIALLRGLLQRRQRGEAVPKVHFVAVIQDLQRLPFLQELLSLHLESDWFELSVHLTRQRILSRVQCFAPGRPAPAAVFGTQEWEGVVICGGYSFAQCHEEYARQHLPGSEIFVEAFNSVNPEGAETAATVRVKARIDGVVLNIDPGKSLLEGLEEQGVSIPNQCRAGICGRCRIKVRSGEYRTSDDFAISAKDRAKGHVLACCTYALGDEISVERPGSQ